MAYISNRQTFTFSHEDIILLNELRRFKIKPSQFVKLALREKYHRDLPILLKEEAKRRDKEFCPF